MNTRKLRKAILTLCSALLLVSLSVGMTIAYLTDTEAVKNTFTVGNVGLNLDETDVWDTEDIGKEYKDGEETKTVTKEMVGEVKPGTNNPRVKENDYQLYPNKTYTKDPIITIDEGSEDCWVIAKVVVEATDIEDVRALIGDENDLLGFGGIVTGGVFNDTYGAPTTADGVTTWTGTNYTLTQQAEADKNVFYVYVNAAQKAEASITLFENLVIPSTWGNTEISKLDGLTMDISAYAVQKDGFDNAQAAFDAAFPND